jgi:hypothetical protein
MLVDDVQTTLLKLVDDVIASSDTETGLRNHVMWLQSRDVTKMIVYRAE